MNPSKDIDPAEYDPQGKAADELARHQATLLSLFEQWEDAFATLRSENKKWRSMGEVKKAIGMMNTIESLWRESKKASDRAAGTRHEDMSILQYRTMLFMERRRQYRMELASADTTSPFEMERSAEPSPCTASLVVGDTRACQLDTKISGTDEHRAKTKQAALDSFFPR